MPTTPTPPTALLGRQPTSSWDKANKAAEYASDVRSGPRNAMSGLSTTDPVSRLPARAAQKLLSLRQEWSDLDAITQRDITHYQELILDRAKAKARVDQLTDRGASLRSGDGEIYAENHPSVISARVEYDRLSAQLEALQSRQKSGTPRRNAIGGLLRQVEGYAKSLGSGVAAYEMDPPELPLGEAPADAVERMRQRRRELIVDLKSVAASPVHSSVVKAKLRKQIEELAERGIPDVYPLIEGGSQVRFAQLDMTFNVLGFVPSVEEVPGIVARANGPIPDALGLIAHLLKDQLIAALDAEVDEASDDENALSADERAARTIEIHEELLAVERLEEGFTELAGGAVVRRADLDPRAYLQISGSDPRGE